MIRQAELIELGSSVVLGEGCTLVGHLTPDGKTHLQGRIRVGDRSLVGGHASLAPDVEIGNDVVLGAETMVLPGVRVGDGAVLGPRCYVSRGVRIPARVRITANSVVREGSQMSEGETWEGNPAVRIETRKKEVQRGSG